MNLQEAIRRSAHTGRSIEELAAYQAQLDAFNVANPLNAANATKAAARLGGLHRLYADNPERDWAFVADLGVGDWNFRHLYLVVDMLRQLAERPGRCRSRAKTLLGHIEPQLEAARSEFIASRKS